MELMTGVCLLAFAVAIAAAVWFLVARKDSEDSPTPDQEKAGGGGGPKPVK